MVPEARNRIGYCTNVHPGASLAEARTGLGDHAAAVRRRLSLSGPLGVGLWLSARAAREVRAAGPGAFRRWLDDRSLDVLSLNGFPYGDFHGASVKHRVYEPDWRDPRRLDYTIDLIEILPDLVEPGSAAGISTLPLGWGHSFTGDDDARQAASNLLKAARRAAEIEAETGTLIHLDLEPEPGCALSTSADVVRFFERHLLPADRDGRVRRHLRVCHDICHAAVMFEAQEDAIARYDAAGIGIGKVQVSSALAAPLEGMDADGRRETVRQLAAFVEPRYLHQTVIRIPGETGLLFFDDLPEALVHEPRGEWRTHFHVPVFLERVGRLETTRPQIEECLRLVAGRPETALEVETYAWNALPAPLRDGELADGIARELDWLAGVLARGGAA